MKVQEDPATGARSSDLQTLARRHLWLAYSPPGGQGPFDDQIRVLVAGEGLVVRDSDGRAYVDAISALEAMVLGHGDVDVIEAMGRQARQLAFLDLFRFAADSTVELAAALAAASPGMEYVHFTPGGAEADEVAIKLARQYHRLNGEPDRTKVLTREGAFHGATMGATEIDGTYFASRNHIYRGGSHSGRVVPVLNCGNCEFGRATPYLPCVHAIEAVIEAEGPETVAAVIVDPVATSLAVANPPDSYLVMLSEICRRTGVLLIVDEVITGMGRTGRLFASQYSGIQPDFITMSKGLSSGYAPIGATLIAPHIAAAFRGEPGVFRHGHTYGGHPVATAAALTVLEKVQSHSLPQRAEKLGERLRDGLSQLTHRRHFWDARGRGLLVGLEIAEDGQSGRQFADRARAGNRLRLICRELGLLTLTLHPGNVLLLAPPLIATEDDIDGIVATIDAALQRMEAE